MKLLEMQQFSNQNKEQINEIINERDELLKKNKELSDGLMQFENKIKEANLIFLNKTEFYNKSLDAYKNKIFDYKKKISILKRKVNELYLIIEKMKLNKNVEFNTNNNINNINKTLHKNLSSTPGPYHRNRGGITPFSKNSFRDKGDISLYNMNTKNNISVYEDKNIDNISTFAMQNNLFKGNKNDKINGQINYGNKEDKLDYEQKNYLEKYKSFLSDLDYQLNH